MGPVGPIGHPGPKGLKVREYLSSHPSIARLKVIPFLLWAVVTVKGWAAVMCVQAQGCWTQHPTGALQWV